MTKAEHYLLMGTISMRDGQYKQSIVSYRCAIMAGDDGQKAFALSRIAKCYYLLENYEKVIDFTFQMAERYGDVVLSKALIEECTRANGMLGDNVLVSEYTERLKTLEEAYESRKGPLRHSSTRLPQIIPVDTEDDDSLEEE